MTDIETIRENMKIINAYINDGSPLPPPGDAYYRASDAVDGIDSILSRLESGDGREARYRKTLGYYADRHNWTDNGDGVYRLWREPDSTTPEAYDGWSLACQALADSAPQGDEGQDRESYTDTQDRESYAPQGERSCETCRNPYDSQEECCQECGPDRRNWTPRQGEGKVASYREEIEARFKSIPSVDAREAEGYELAHQILTAKHGGKSDSLNWLATHDAALLKDERERILEAIGNLRPSERTWHNLEAAIEGRKE